MLKKLFLLMALLVACAAFSSLALADAEKQEEKEFIDDGEVVVTASRYDENVHLNLTNITAADLLYKEPDLPLPLLLQDVPGLFAYSDAGSGLGYTYLRIRGFDQRRVGVLINGIPFNDPEDHQLWWVDMPDLASSVEDIQVQRGVTNSIGGMTAMGGTVNIVTDRLAAEEQGRLNLTTGSYGFARQMLTYQTGNLKGGLRSSLRITHQKSDGYRDRTAVDQWGYFWSGLHQTDKMVTQINFYTGREQTQHAWNAVPEAILEQDRTHNPETYHNAIDDFTQPHTELHNTYFLNEDLTLINRLYYIQGEGYYENFKEEERAADYSLDAFLGLESEDEVNLVRRKYVRKDQVGWVPSLEWKQSDRSRLVIGGDWYTFHSNHWGEVLGVDGFTPGDLLRGDVGLKYHSYTGDKDAFSLYANERFALSEKLTLLADLQYQHKEYKFLQNEVGNFTGDQRNGYTVEYDFFNPKGGLHLAAGRAAGGDLAFYGSVGVNHREPTDNELFDTWEGGDDLGVRPLFDTIKKIHYLADGVTVDWVEWSDPRVQEEKVVDYELGMNWAGENLSFTLGGYWMDFENEIVPYGGTNEEGLGIRGNAARTLHRGLELGLRARVTPRNLLTVAASRSWDEFDEFEFIDWDGTPYDYSGNPIALFPDRLLSVALRTSWNEKVASQVRARHVGRQQLDNTGDADRVIDPYSTLDFSIWADLSVFGLEGLAGARAFLHVRNLGDTEYETYGYYDGWNGGNHYIPGPSRNFALGVDYDF
jgi:iron complex outermembrane receptor protein